MKHHAISVEENTPETGVQAGTLSTSQRRNAPPSDEMEIKRERAQMLVSCVPADIATWPIVDFVRTLRSKRTGRTEHHGTRPD